ncbi:MAG: hypothetical protein F6J93_18510 [Oscillatoria sp. SIO1A7]|nr:hypothetical protein [Oscillatoria sp. SIO1A7]
MLAAIAIATIIAQQLAIAGGKGDRAPDFQINISPSLRPSYELDKLLYFVMVLTLV